MPSLYSEIASHIVEPRKQRLRMMHPNISIKIKAPSFPLHNLVSPCPFSMWGTDVIGPVIQKH